MPRVKSHYVTGLEGLIARWREMAQAQRELTPSVGSAIADSYDFAARELEETLQRLENPTTLLTPAEWGDLQDPKVTMRTVQRWIARGELDAVRTSKGFKVPRGAERREPSTVPLQAAS